MVDRSLVVEPVQPRSLIESCGPLLESREAEHSLMFAVAGRMRDTELSPAAAYAAPMRSGGTTTLVTLRTPPMHLLLSVSVDPGAVDALARHIVRVDPALNGVNGRRRRPRKLCGRGRC